MKDSERPQTLVEAVLHFSDEAVAHAYVVEMRWGDTVKCYKCGTEKVSYIQTQKRWKCGNKECEIYRKQFSVKKGTIFEDSAIKLSKWLIAMWMIANNKNGKSSYELARDLKVTQKSAWFMLHRIRTAFDNGTIEKLKGTIEVDETFVGGKAKNMHKDKKEAKIQGRGASGKAIVMGILERSEEGSTVEAKVISIVGFTLDFTSGLSSIIYIRDSYCFIQGYCKCIFDNFFHEWSNKDIFFFESFFT